MKTAAALVGVGVGLLLLSSGGKSEGRTVVVNPDGSKTPLPEPGKGPKVKTHEEALGRVVAALATGDPATMRAEAAKLRKDGFPDEADDLEHAAFLREEELAAAAGLPELPPGIPRPPLPGGSTQHPPIGGATTSMPPVKVPKTPAPKTPARPNPRLPGATETLPAGPRTLRLTSPYMQGTDVSTWQEVLRNDGFADLKMDGIYGPATRDATVLWQTDLGLTPDGIVGDNTRGSVLKRPPIKLGARVLRKGSQGPAVKAWQSVLYKDGYHLPTTGNFTISTEQATQAWQFERDLTADGIVGKNTLAKVGTAPVPLPGPPKPKAALPMSAWRTLRLTSPMMQGEDVAAWQLVLNRTGYPTIKPDGVFGPATASATIQWQNANGLRPGDGIVGSNTRARIPSSALVAGDWDSVSGDLHSTGIRAVSPLPGILPAEAPDEVVEENRRLAAQLALHISETPVGHEDRRLVTRYQASEGLNATGNYGAATAVSLVRYGIVPPRPLYWPKKERERTRLRYVSTMLEQAKLDPQRADEWQHAADV